MRILNKNTTSKSDFEYYICTIMPHLNEYNFYHYKNYPSKNMSGWVELFLNDLEVNFENENCYIFCSDSSSEPYFISYNINKWDQECFDVKMAKSTLAFMSPAINKSVLTNFVKQIKIELKRVGVAFLTTRIHGDNLALINAHNANGFEYFETIVWPVLKTSSLNLESIDGCEVLTDKDELGYVIDIAKHHHYQRGHFHCEPRIDIAKANNMCVRWVETSFNNDDTICIIRVDNTIVGYFICGVDERLSKYLGVKYGRLKSLALNSNYRGQHLGQKLFKGTLKLLASKECEYIDSGYATKNHTSAYLHTLTQFYSNYEEVTLHCWLDFDVPH